MPIRWQSPTHDAVGDLDFDQVGGKDQFGNTLPVCLRLYLHPTWATVPGPTGLVRTLTSEPLTGSEAQAAYQAMLFEHQTANMVIGLVAAHLPESMRVAVLDGDEPTGEYLPRPEHALVFDFGEPDNILSFSVPGADINTLAAVRGVVAAEYGDTVRVA